MILISNDFWLKRKINNFDQNNVLLAIATNIAVLLMTASVHQRHKHQNLQYFKEYFSQKIHIFTIS